MFRTLYTREIVATFYQLSTAGIFGNQQLQNYSHAQLPKFIGVKGRLQRSLKLLKRFWTILHDKNGSLLENELYNNRQ